MSLLLQRLALCVGLLASNVPTVYAAAENAIKFGPSAEARSAILSGDRARLPYPGTATDNAVIAGYDDVVVLLLSDPDRRKSEGPGALLAAIQRPSPHLVGLILALGISPNDVDGGGPGALAYAVTAGENRTLCRLLDYSVQLSGGRMPHLPMLAALTSGNLDAAQLLRFVGYEPDEFERDKIEEIGKKRGQWKFWDGLLSVAPNEEKAMGLCRRLNAVPPSPSRLH